MATDGDDETEAAETGRFAVGVGQASISVQVKARGIALLGGIPSEEILLQAAVVDLGAEKSEGRLIESVSIAWFEIIDHLSRDADFLFRVSPRKLEEIIAGAYEREGYDEVMLTPPSGDHGRDIIATKAGLHSIRIIDQVKRYKRGHVVTADEVRALFGVLSLEQNVSKGIVTTTSEFAPRIREDPLLSKVIPYRLELKNGQQLRQWLLRLLRTRH